MKKLFLILIISLAYQFSQAQVKIPIRGDSIIFNQTGGGTAEFILENSTKNVQYGFLQNRINGRTKFALALDSVYIENGNIKFRRGGSLISIPVLTPSDTTSTIATKNDLNNQFLGTRYSATSFSSTSDFTNNGATFTPSGGKLVGGGPSASNYSKSLDLSFGTMVEHWRIYFGFTVTIKNDTTLGPAFGIRSTNSTSKINAAATFNMTNSADSGKFSINVGDSYGQGAITTTGLAFAVGDSIEGYIERDVDKLSVVGKNVTKGSTEITTSWKHVFSNGTFMPNTGRVAIFKRSNGFSVYKLKYEVLEPMNPELLLIIDSKGYYFASNYIDAFSNKLKFVIPNIVVCAGPGDQIKDVVFSLAEKQAFNPKRIAWIIGSNSARNSESGYIARLDSMVALFPKAQHFFVEPFYEPGLDQTAYLNHIRSSYPNNTISIYDEFKKNYKAYLYSDSVHLTDAGHLFVYNKFIDAFKVLQNKAVTSPESWIINQKQRQQIGNFWMRDSCQIDDLLSLGSYTEDRLSLRLKNGPDQIMDAYSNSTWNTFDFHNRANNAGSAWKTFSSYTSFNARNPSTTNWLFVDPNGTITWNTMSASLPLKTDASKNMISAAINLTGSEVTGNLPLSKGGISTSETSTASSSTPTPTGDSRENFFDITALAANATFAAPSGTPANHNTLLIRVKDNGTARTLSWNAIYRAGTDLPLPTTTVISKTDYYQYIYNSADSKWDYIGQTKGF